VRCRISTENSTCEGKGGVERSNWGRIPDGRGGCTGAFVHTKLVSLASDHKGGGPIIKKKEENGSGILLQRTRVGVGGGIRARMLSLNQKSRSFGQEKKRKNRTREEEALDETFPKNQEEGGTGGGRKARKCHDGKKKQDPREINLLWGNGTILSKDEKGGLNAPRGEGGARGGRGDWIVEVGHEAGDRVFFDGDYSPKEEKGKEREKRDFVVWGDGRGGGRKAALGAWETPPGEMGT